MTSETCWADPLSRKERTELAGKLARACGASYRAPLGSGEHEPVADNEVIRQHITASIEMSDLHLDVTERAAVPAR